jgi:UDP-glucose 4-epimerase
LSDSSAPSTKLDLEAFAERRVLITGGLGFIGSTLARKLVDLGARVTVVDSLIPEYGGNLFNLHGYDERLRINISDVRDEHSFRYLIQDQDLLFNLAGQTSHLDSMSDPFVDLEINCRAQLSIVEACRKYNPGVKVVFASTRQIYGRPSRLPVDESHALNPVDVNGIHKMAGERYHILYNDVYGLDACALRLTNTYGPRMRIRDARQTFLGVWVRQLLRGERFEVWGGEQLRDFTFVSDAVDAFLLAAQRDTAGAILNLGGAAPVNLRNLAEMLIGINGAGEYAIREFPQERQKIDVGDYYADDSAARSLLGWEPGVSLEKGLAVTLDFYRRHFDAYA